MPTYRFTNQESLEGAYERAPKLAGNHRKFDSFAWPGRYDLDDDRDYAIVYTSNRDADVLTRSNAKVTNEALKPYLDYEHAWRFSASHWACGHVDGYVIRVYLEGPPEADGERPLSAAFVEYSAIQDALEQYPVLDESDFSDAEQEEADLVWKDCYSTADRLEYVRDHRSQFEFRSFSDMLGCIRGNYFAGYASELLG